MAGAAAIKAGRAYVEFFGEDSKLIRTMNKIDKRLSNWGKQVAVVGKSVAAAGLAVLSPLLGAAAIFENMGSALNDMAARTGASVEALSSLGFAAEQSGASLEDVETGLKKMSKLVFSAATGNKEAATTLRYLGLQLKDLARLAPEEQFRLMASRIAMIQNPTQRAAIAMQVFGKTGTALLPMIGELATLEARARELGLVMSTQDAKAADTLGDAWGELKAVGKALVFQVGAALAPMLSNLATKAAETGAAFIQWVRDNRELIVTVAKVAGIVIAAGVAIVVLGGIISAVGAAFGALATIIGFVVGVVTFLGAAFSFLVSPMGLILVGLAALTVAFFKFTDLGQQALQFLSETFASFAGDAIKAWQGIRDAIGNGDIGQAMVVVGTFLTLQWAKVTAFLWQKWSDFLNMMVPAAIDIAKRVANIFIDMSLQIVNALLSMTDLIKQITGKDIIDPKLRQGLGAALPALAAGLKASAGIGLDKLGGNLLAGGNAAAAAALDNKNKSQTAFEDAVAAAAKAGKKFNPTENAMNIGDVRDGLSQAKAAVSGTFSAAAAQGFGGESEISKVAENTADMKASLKKIAAKPAMVGVI